jgi:hypothetical protein
LKTKVSAGTEENVLALLKKKKSDFDAQEAA